ncbi:Dicer-like protein 1 [Sarracenia purpurea var. burkii]
MGDESRVSGRINPSPEKDDTRAPSYWLDAYEDISCHFIDDFVDCDVDAVPETVTGTSNEDAGADPCLFGGIDRILDGIKNGAGLSPVLNSNSDSALSDHCVPGGPKGIDNGDKGAVSCKMPVFLASQGSDSCNGVLDNSDNANNNHNDNNITPPGNSNTAIDLYTDRDDKEGRYNGRALIVDYNYKNVRHSLSRGQYLPREREWERERERERPSGRKRPRDWEDIDRRERDQIKRKVRYENGKKDYRDREWRESRGYWERERPGSNEMVFRLGTWEAERNREGNTPTERNQDCNAKVEKEPEEAKEKIPEEQARRYQLDVLEQAKKKNTIAFLETGAGKTLIAVLLIRSIYSDLQKENKNMLAVFLVPKVPLVYQVTLCPAVP